jgi:hypothetical protein
MTVAQAQERLVGEVEAEARAARELSGQYIVAFRNPWRGAQQRAELKDRIRGYVRRTVEVPTAEAEDVTAGGQVVCSMCKRGAQDDVIGTVFDGGVELGGFVPDIRTQLTTLLRRAIAGKANKMAGLSCPAVLVLYDLYWVARQPLFCECVRAVPEATAFRHIYVVQGKGVGYEVELAYRKP